MNKQEQPIIKIEDEIKEIDSKLTDLGIRMSNNMMENQEKKRNLPIWMQGQKFSTRDRTN